jgi:hypothetical protein
MLAVLEEERQCGVHKLALLSGKVPSHCTSFILTLRYGDLSCFSRMSNSAKQL